MTNPMALFLWPFTNIVLAPAPLDPGVFVLAVVMSLTVPCAPWARMGANGPQIA